MLRVPNGPHSIPLPGRCTGQSHRIESVEHALQEELRPLRSGRRLAVQHQPRPPFGRAICHMREAVCELVRLQALRGGRGIEDGWPHPALLQFVSSFRLS